eukprot:m.294747 g.294747  ORF g.294747 m.294747 type:complete len:120 (-) comp16389_c0_seq110:4156-4515(-)
MMAKQGWLFNKPMKGLNCKTGLRDTYILNQGFAKINEEILPEHDESVKYSKSLCNRLAQGICRLREKAWHPIWIFIFDESYELIGNIGGPLLEMVNSSLQINWDCWAWHIDKGKQERGW